MLIYARSRESVHGIERGGIDSLSPEKIASIHLRLLLYLQQLEHGSMYSAVSSSVSHVFGSVAGTWLSSCFTRVLGLELSSSLKLMGIVLLSKMFKRLFDPILNYVSFYRTHFNFELLDPLSLSLTNGKAKAQLDQLKAGGSMLNASLISAFTSLFGARIAFSFLGRVTPFFQEVHRNFLLSFPVGGLLDIVSYVGEQLVTNQPTKEQQLNFARQLSDIFSLPAIKNEDVISGKMPMPFIIRAILMSGGIEVPTGCGFFAFSLRIPKECICAEIPAYPVLLLGKILEEELGLTVFAGSNEEIAVICKKIIPLTSDKIAACKRVFAARREQNIFDYLKFIRRVIQKVSPKFGLSLVIVNNENDYPFLALHVGFANDDWPFAEELKRHLERIFRVSCSDPVDDCFSILIKDQSTIPDFSGRLDQYLKRVNEAIEGKGKEPMSNVADVAEVPARVMFTSFRATPHWYIPEMPAVEVVRKFPTILHYDGQEFNLERSDCPYKMLYYQGGSYETEIMVGQLTVAKESCRSDLEFRAFENTLVKGDICSKESFGQYIQRGPFTESNWPNTASYKLHPFMTDARIYGFLVGIGYVENDGKRCSVRIIQFNTYNANSHNGRGVCYGNGTNAEELKLPLSEEEAQSARRGLFNAVS